MTAVPVARVATRPHHTRLSPAQRAELLRLLIAARTALRERARMLATVDGSFDASTATGATAKQSTRRSMSNAA